MPPTEETPEGVIVSPADRRLQGHLLGVELPIYPKEAEGVGYFNRSLIAAVVPAANEKRSRLIITGIVQEYIIDMPIKEVVALIRI